MKPTAARLEQLFGAESIGTLPTGIAFPAGVESVPVVAPADLDVARAVLEVAARDGWRVLPAGAGEHLGRGGAIGSIDLVLSSRRMRSVIEYEPAEMVLEAEAGLTLHELESIVAPHGQRLASDPWPARAATLGGAVAGNRFGLGRRRAGTLRDALLGARVLQADGRVSKTGGKVVKNVAGFDLGKLYVGSYGSLVFLHRIVVRLASRPETTALVCAGVDRTGAEAALLAVHRASVEPTALLLVAGAIGATLPLVAGQVGIVARFEGRDAAVRQQVDITRRLLNAAIWPADRTAQTYDALRIHAEPRPDAVLVRLSTLPVTGAGVLEDLEALASWQPGGSCIVQFGVGTAHAQLPGLSSRELRVLRGAIAARGGRLAVEHAPVGFDAGVDTIDDAVVRDLMQRTRAAFDPAGRWRTTPLGSTPP